MKTVLFVCVENAGRSQMAEAFFNKLAQVKAKAISAGASPAQQIDPKVVEVMGEIGIDIKHQKPKRLTPKMLEQADLVVTMGCEAEKACPATFTATQNWELDDPKGQPLEKVREIRDQIKARVRELWSQTNGGKRRGSAQIAS